MAVAKLGIARGQRKASLTETDGCANWFRKAGLARDVEEYKVLVDLLEAVYPAHKKPHTKNCACPIL